MFLKTMSPVKILKKVIAACNEKIERFEMNQYPGIKLGIFDEARTDKLQELRLRKNQLLQELNQLDNQRISETYTQRHYKSIVN